MFETKAYMKKSFKIEIKSTPDTKAACAENNCWLCEREFKNEDHKENPVVKDHCNITCIFSGLAQKNAKGIHKKHILYLH